MEKLIDLTIIRVCTKCGEEKPLTEFGVCMVRKYKYNRHSQCKKCKQEYESNRRSSNPISRQKSCERSRIWRKNNPDKYKDVIFESRWRLLGVPFTKEMYEILMEKQGGVCAICQKIDIVKEKEVRLSVDHNHETGKVRGLLCGKCNRAIGLLKDDSELVFKASLYLKESNS